jgi:hypothetical protein
MDVHLFSISLAEVQGSTLLVVWFSEFEWFLSIHFARICGGNQSI